MPTSARRHAGPRGRRWNGRRRTVRRVPSWCADRLATVQPGARASWAGLSLGCLPRNLPLALATFMPLPRPHLDQVRLEFGDHREDVEQEPPDRIGGIVDRPADGELHAGLGEVFDDVARVGHRMTVAVELPSPGIISGGSCENRQCRRSCGQSRRWRPGWSVPLGVPLTALGRRPIGAPRQDQRRSYADSHIVRSSLADTVLVVL